jgi:hypothetical protein
MLKEVCDMLDLIDFIDDVLSEGTGKRKQEVQRGDIIGVDRGLYQHYAVYIGNDKVIHYSGSQGDFNDDIYIREASFQEFLGDSTEYFICQFSNRYKAPRKRCSPALLPTPTGLLDDTIDILKNFQYHLFTPEETVARAYSRLGERKYDIINNNCEHFAIWCKTNISESGQVRALLGHYTELLRCTFYT